MLMLIDADYTAYGSAESAEKEIQWDDDTFSIYGDLKTAQESFEWRLKQYQEMTGLKDFKLTFSHGKNFRKALNPEYKGGRKRKPVGYGALKAWAMETYPCFVKEGLEADDCLGILQTKYPGKTVIVTVDKDLLTIPGKLFRLKPKGGGEWHETSEKDAWFAFLSQALSGDVTDGYTGCPGFGKATADKLLKARGAVWKTVEDAYIAAGLTAEDALMNARMARILRADDWDFDKQEVKLWTPS